MAKTPQKTTHFGNQTVAEDQKAGMVHGVFSSVASKYDVMNDAMSMGIHRTLPFPDNTFDAYTISFGIRNVTRIPDAIAEAYRVLKPGGRFMVLEFSTIPTPGLQKLYDLYSFNVIPKMGQVIAGDADSYQYLVESIRQFPKQEPFAQMIREAGFEQVSYRNMTMGIAALHSGWKI